MLANWLSLPQNFPPFGGYKTTHRRAFFSLILNFPLFSTMAESKTKFAEIREWIIEHKLRTVGCLWLSGISGSIAYNWSKPAMKTSVRIIHARLHAQALTLAALAGAAAVEYYDHKSGATDPRIPKFLKPENLTKD